MISDSGISKGFWMGLYYEARVFRFPSLLLNPETECIFLALWYGNIILDNSIFKAESTVFPLDFSSSIGQYIPYFVKISKEAAISS